MTGSWSPSLEKFLASLTGRVGLVLLTSLVSAGALSILLSIYLKFDLTLLTGMLMTGLGLISGAASRWILRKNTRLLQLLSAFVGVFLGLLVFGTISRGGAGLGLSFRDSGPAAWNTVLQVFWSGFVAWLSVRAWNRPTKKAPLPEKKPAVMSPLGQPGPKSKPVPSTLKTHLGKPIKSQKKLRKSQKKLRKSQKKLRKSQEKLRKPQENLRKLSITNPFSSFVKRIDLQKRLMEGRERFISVVNAKWGRHLKMGKRVRVGSAKPSVRVHKPRLINQKREIVKLVGVEEHNCPYCLEVVTKKDPRGLKICATCKTWHHADCWAEAGECQVPHQHDL